MKKILKQFLLCAMSGILFLNTPLTVFAENVGTPKTYELKVTASKGGTVAVEGQKNADSYHFQKDEKVTLQITPKDGYLLERVDTEDIEDFLEESTESEISFLMPDHDVDLRCVFGKEDAGDESENEAEIAERKALAKEKGLEKWIDNDGYLMDDFFDGKSDLEISKMGISKLINSIDLNSGVMPLSVTKYYKVTYGNTSVGYFEVDGRTAVCCEHDKTTPVAGSPTGSPELITDKNLRTIMYYGYNGPANIFTSDLNKSCVATSLALSYYVRGLSSTGMGGAHSAGAQKCGMSDLIYKAEQNAYVPDNFKVYRVTTNGGSTQRLMYSVLEAQTYKVTYDGNGGLYNGSKTWSENVTYNTDYKTWDNFFTRSGYTFTGWNEKADGTGVSWTSYIGKTWKYQYQHDVTLYAQWTPTKYTTTIAHWMWGFENKEGNNGDKNAYNIANDSVSRTIGTTFKITADDLKAIPKGFKNGGTVWCGTDRKSYPLGTQFTQNSDYYFELGYSPIAYNVTYDLDGGMQNASNPTSYNVIYAKNLYKPTKEGYTFAGWTQENNLLGDGIHDYTFTNTTDGNRYSYSKIQLWNINQSNKSWEYPDGREDVIESSTSGHVSKLYTHKLDSGVYAIRVGANGNKSDGDSWVYDVYFEKGAQYQVDYDLNYDPQKIVMNNVTIKRITPVSVLNKGKNASGLTSSNYYAESCTRQIGDVKLKANWTKKYAVNYDTQGGSLPSKGSTSDYKIIDNGDYVIRGAVGSQTRYMHAEHDGWNNYGPNVVLFNTASTDGEQYQQTIWTFERYKDTEYYYITNKKSGKALRAYNTNDLYSLQLESQQLNDFFLWKLKDVGNGQTTIVNKAIDKCIDVASAVDEDSTRIIAFTSNGTAAQKWYLEKLSTKDYPTRYALDGISSIYVNSVEPVKEDYEFAGWNTKADGSGTTYKAEDLYKFDGNTDVTLYAQWKALGYTVKFHANDGTGSMDNVTPFYGKDYTLPGNTFTREGYTFKNWLDKNRSTTWKNKGTINYTKDQTNNGVVDLYAEWDPIEYDITYDSNKPASASGTVTGSTASSHHKYDESKNLTANGYKLTGWTFTGWNTKKDGSGQTYSDKQAVFN